MAAAGERASTLAWRDARRDDRRHLQAFVCTSPDHAKWLPARRARVHPRQWELDVQAAIRKLKPPPGPHARLRLAFDKVGLAAVVHVVVATENDHGILVPVIALAQRLRGGKHHRGGELAGEALRAASDLKAAHKMEGVGVFARVHPRNTASGFAFAAAGFEKLDGLFHTQDPAPGPLEHHRCDECVESWVATV